MIGNAEEERVKKSQKGGVIKRGGGDYSSQGNQGETGAAWKRGTTKLMKNYLGPNKLLKQTIGERSRKAVNSAAGGRKKKR